MESPDDVALSAYTIDSDWSRSISAGNSYLDDLTDSPTKYDNFDWNSFHEKEQSAKSKSPRKTVDLMEQKIRLFDKIVESAKLEKSEPKKTEPKKTEKLELPFGSRSKINFKDLQKQIAELKKKLNESPQKYQEQVDNKNYAKIVQVTFDNKTLIPQKVEIFDKEAYLKTNEENPKDLVSMKTFIAYQLQNNNKGLTTDATTTMSFYYNGDETEASKLNFENPIL